MRATCLPSAPAPPEIMKIGVDSEPGWFCCPMTVLLLSVLSLDEDAARMAYVDGAQYIAAGSRMERRDVCLRLRSANAAYQRAAD